MTWDDVERGAVDGHHRSAPSLEALGGVAHGMVNVRLFAVLRELAGASEVQADGRTAGDVVDVLSSRYGERFAQIAAVGSVVVNGERAARSTPVAAGDEVALLPPVSGGSRRRNLPD